MLGDLAKPIKAIQEFVKLESSSGLLLIAATIVALLLENSSLSVFYDQLLQMSASVRIGPLSLDKPLLLWINDGFMAIFFLLVGLEVKREMREGQLTNLSQITLPGIAAIGGMTVPALIYVWLNKGDEMALNGWAIPAATDIAFALGILSLLGNRVPLSLKLLLMTVAIMDDLGAILIIAVFYSTDVSLLSLILAAVMLVILFGMNRAGVTRIAPYMIVGVVLWVFVLKSGVHATLAGVVLAFAIPLRAKNDHEHSPLRHLEHSLHPWVAFGIMPLFAFANAGVSLGGFSWPALLEPVPLGIILGLFIGKQLGVFGFTWLGVRFKIAKLPADLSWFEFYGMAVLCGIGFTMSLFIASLAFEHGGAVDYIAVDRLGVLLGSLLSAGCGYALLRYALNRKRVDRV
jgi:NhaA family Na+:H+ antiporter